MSLGNYLGAISEKFKTFPKKKQKNKFDKTFVEISDVLLQGNENE